MVVGGLLYNDGLILHSEDLTSWSPVHDIVLPPMYKVTWTGDQFVALGDLGYLLTSPDGLQWTRHGTGTELWLHGAASGNGTLVVVGERGLILIGSDGTDFNQLELITPSSLHDVIWNGEVFVAGGRDGTILRSRNGLDWTVGDSGFEGTIHDLLWTGESFIAATSTTLLTSRDAHHLGASWGAPRRELRRRCLERQPVPGCGLRRCDVPQPLPRSRWD